MESTHTPFLNAIHQDPDSVGLRLRYADFLEESGEPALSARAEFIRVQSALESPDLDDESRKQLRLREMSLLESHWREWFDPVRRALGEPEFIRRGGLRWWAKQETFEVVFRVGRGFVVRSTPLEEIRFSARARFRRGFVDDLTVSDAAGMGRVPDYEALFHATPLTAINFEGDERSVISLIRANRNGQLRSLRLFPQCSDSTLALIADAPESNRLRHLAILSMGSTDTSLPFDSISALLEGKSLNGLRHLELNLVGRYSPGIDRLLGSELLARLETLEIRTPGTSIRLLTELVRSEVTPSLKRLRLNVFDRVPPTLLAELLKRFGENFSLRIFDEGNPERV